jgi:hypothetical protein
MTGWHGMRMGRGGIVDLAKESAHNGRTDHQDNQDCTVLLPTGEGHNVSLCVRKWLLHDTIWGRFRIYHPPPHL